MATTRSAWVGPATRPVYIPDDIDDPRSAKASGLVQLPFHIRWSEPSPVYDLDDRIDRARVYEQVLREGTTDDVRYFVRLAELVAVWDDLVLPGYVRSEWQTWFA